MNNEKPLNEIMGFEHVIRVNPDGSIEDANLSVGSTGAYFDLRMTENSEGQWDDEFELSPGWELLKGFTGQYSYNGPVMHPSEYIGGGLEAHIRATPGYYVALVVEAYDIGKHEWQRSRFGGNVTCTKCGLLPQDDDDLESPCYEQSADGAGWAIAYKPLEEETDLEPKMGDYYS